MMRIIAAWSDHPMARALMWAFPAVVGWRVGTFAARFDIEKQGTLLVAVFGVMLGLAYLLRGISPSRLFALCVVTLPFSNAFVLEIGGTVRIAYLFAVAALLLGLYTGTLRKVRIGLPGELLGLFVFYAFLSTLFTLWVDRPVVSYTEADPFRLSPFRTYIQAGQLVLMLVGFYLTLNHLNSIERLRRFSNLVFWPTALVSTYGIYEFFSLLLGRPFIRLHRNLIDAWVTLGSLSLPRPKSTLSEPIDLGIYLLFAIPFCIVAVVSERRLLWRWLKIIGTVLAVLLFVAANSRSAFLGALFVLPSAVFVARSPGARRRIMGLIGLVGLGAAAVGATVMRGDEPTADLLSGLQSRLGSMTYILANLEGSKGGLAIGRNYADPIDIFYQNPVLGVGLGNYTFYYKKEEGDLVVASTFSLYLRLLTELGIVGTAVFLCFVASIVVALRRVIREIREPTLKAFAAASFLAIIGVMVARVGTDGLYTDIYLWVMFATGIAAVRLARRNEHTRESTVRAHR